MVFKIYCDGTAGNSADKVRGEGRSRVKDDTHVWGHITWGRLGRSWVRFLHKTSV